MADGTDDLSSAAVKSATQGSTPPDAGNAPAKYELPDRSAGNISEQPKDKKPEPPKSILSDRDKREITKAVHTEVTDVMNPVKYEQIRRIAADVWKGGQVPKTYESQEQVFQAMLVGTDLGFTPLESISNGYYMDGKYNVYGKAVGIMLRRKGWRWQFEEDKEAEVTSLRIWHRDDADYVIEDDYSYEEAEQSGFTTYEDRYNHETKDKLGWRKGANRRRKLRYGVLSLVLHTYIPEVLGASAGIAEYSEDYTAALDPGETASEEAAGRAAVAASRAVAAFHGGAKLQPTKPAAIGEEPQEHPADDLPTTEQQ